MATKPYASGGAYINKMSNYCYGCSYSPDTKVGQGACPFNLLYWNFYETHQDRFANNPRTAMMVRSWLKRPEKERREILTQAESFLNGLT